MANNKKRDSLVAARVSRASKERLETIARTVGWTSSTLLARVIERVLPDLERQIEQHGHLRDY